MRFPLIALILVLLAPGCAELQDHRYRVANHLRAQAAWKEQGQGVMCDAFGAPSSHYREGWEAGYYEVLTGGPDIPPAVPPRQYWDPEFQTPEGQVAIDEWFNGYQAGAMIAKCSPIENDIPFRQSPFSNHNESSPIHYDVGPHDEYQTDPAPAYPTFPSSVSSARSVRPNGSPLEEAGQVPQRSLKPARQVTASSAAAAHSTQVGTSSSNLVADMPLASSSRPPVLHDPSIHWGSKRTASSYHTSLPAPPAPRRVTQKLAPGYEHISDGKLEFVNHDQILAMDGWRPHRR